MIIEESGLQECIEIDEEYMRKLGMEVIHNLSEIMQEWKAKVSTFRIQRIKKTERNASEHMYEKLTPKQTLPLWWRRRFAHQARGGLGPNILIDMYL